METLNEKVADCRKCIGAAYQTFPLMVAGNTTTGRLVIGQNPGEIKSTDSFRLSMADEANWMMENDMLGPMYRDGAIRMYYQLDFMTSPMAQKLVAILGPDWGDSWAFTNAVRCRTPNNNAPSPEMIANCIDWTDEAISTYGFKSIILLGAVARKQAELIFGLSIENNKPIHNPTKKINLVALPHPSAWKYEQPATIQSYKQSVQAMLEYEAS